MQGNDQRNCSTPFPQILFSIDTAILHLKPVTSCKWPPALTGKKLANCEALYWTCRIAKEIDDLTHFHLRNGIEPLPGSLPPYMSENHR